MQKSLLVPSSVMTSPVEFKEVVFSPLSVYVCLCVCNLDNPKIIFMKLAVNNYHQRISLRVRFFGHSVECITSSRALIRIVEIYHRRFVPKDIMI